MNTEQSNRLREQQPPIYPGAGQKPKLCTVILTGYKENGVVEELKHRGMMMVGGYPMFPVFDTTPYKKFSTRVEIDPCFPSTNSCSL